MKQRKIAISLAVIGAIVAPFVLHTYKINYPRWQTWRPLIDAEQMKVNLARCSSAELSDEGSSCQWHRKALDDGGYYAPEPSVVLYLLLNMAVAVAGFVIVFGLSYLLPALTRRYWRWLNT
jgi:hypothetical protein